MSKGSQYQPTVRPTEYRCYIKEAYFPYATAGAETASWKNPSSSGQLPVPVALNAPSPTLFFVIIHDWEEIVNTFFADISRQKFSPQTPLDPLSGIANRKKMCYSTIYTKKREEAAL
ncbi:MAG: hypothetical protein E7433_03805 [Ruminococcaceae bacterium]|nr:hypothetical protein [Oscillospiraceae bacterium]